MAVPMPPVLVLIVCKVLFVGAPDDNAKLTGWRDTQWDVSQGTMHCQRHEIQLYDPFAGQPSNPSDPKSEPTPELSLNPESCRRAAMQLGPQYDVDNRDRPWRFWRAACPTPIYKDEKSNEIIGWKLPDCGAYAGVVMCELDTAI